MLRTQLRTQARQVTIWPRLISRYSTNPQQPPHDPKVSTGVDDKNTNTHGFDPLKPRKPLSRVAIGQDEPSKMLGRTGPRTSTLWKSALIVILGGGALTWLFNRERRRLQVRKAEKEHQGIGKPQIGGPFNLIDSNGQLFTDKDLLGKFSIIYFGFTKCPDICPEELDVLAEVLRTTNKTVKKIQPIFITCDPARDSPEVLKEYLSDFHPDIIGLTGTYEEIKNVCKQYRVYFSTPPDLKPGDDYLVDHSIFFYIMDPEGQYIDVMGRNYNGKEATEKVLAHLDAWRPSSEDQRSWVEKLTG